jgi:hypothetical protein
MENTEFTEILKSLLCVLRELCGEIIYKPLSFTSGPDKRGTSGRIHKNVPLFFSRDSYAPHN